MKKISIINNKRVITENGRLADSFFSRLRGLMFVQSIADDYALYITPCNQIHMLNMRFAIDVVYLSQDDRVVKIDENVQPGKICKTERRAKSVIEMKAGAASALGICQGDVLEIMVQK